MASLAVVVRMRKLLIPLACLLTKHAMGYTLPQAGYEEYQPRVSGDYGDTTYEPLSKSYLVDFIIIR